MIERNSFKNTLFSIVAFLLCFIPLSLMLTINTPSGKFKAKAYGIEYKVAYKQLDQEWSEYPERENVMDEYWSIALKTNGNYPTSYISGEETVVDDLKTSFRYNYSDGGYVAYRFDGWFLDEAYTIPFDGVITADMTNDLVIYAKIVCTGAATGFY